MSEKISEIMSDFVETGIDGISVLIEEVSDWEELHKVSFFDRIDIHEDYLGRELALSDLLTAQNKIAKNTASHLNPDLAIKADWCGSGDLFEIALYLEERHEDMTVDEVINDIWSFIIACVNMTDRGTFGWEYLFGE